MDRYRGPEPSDTVEMFEGEKFFAAFERGIDVDAGKSLLQGALGCDPLTRPTEFAPLHRPSRLRGWQNLLCFLFTPEECKGGVHHHSLGPGSSGCPRPGGLMCQDPQVTWTEATVLNPICRQRFPVMQPLPNNHSEA